MNIDFDKIAKQIPLQSEEIKKIIFSYDFGSLIQNISESNNLSEDQMFKLNDEICYVLLGFTYIDNFDKSLDVLNVDEKVKTKIYQKVQEDIFKPVLGVLKNRKVLLVSENNEKYKVIYEKIKKLVDNNGSIRTKLEEILNSTDRMNIDPEIKNYLDSLDEKSKNIIKDHVWTNKTKEICKKYSLDEKQLGILENLALFVLLNIESKENFLESLVSELGISRLLAEQIMEEVEKRVFEYALKVMETSSKDLASKSTPDYTFDTEIPEIRPDITPMVEKAKPDFSNPVAQPTESGIREEVAHTTPAVSASISTQQISADKNNISVPRYFPPVPNNLPNEEIKSAQTPVVSTNTSPNQEKPVETPKPVEKSPEKYTVDPYREPLE